MKSKRVKASVDHARDADYRRFTGAIRLFLKEAEVAVST
jgi:hypothetical protein